MTLDIRPITHEEMGAMQRVTAIVFGNYPPPPPDAANPGNLLPEWTLCAFEDGELATSYAAYPFTMRLNGAPAPAAGVTAVGTLPWYRRRGHLRAIMETDFRRRYEQREQPLAILLASIAAIYQRYGYAVVSSRYRYSIDPRWINIAPSLVEAKGNWRDASQDELPLLKQLYKDYATPRNGYLHRGMPMWHGRVLGTVQYGGGDGFAPSLLSVYEEHGEPQGYVAWAAKWFPQHEDGAGPGQRLLVRDYVYKTPTAYRAMWDFLKKFDLVNRVIVDVAPPDDPAFDVMLDPRELHATRYDHLLGRIIDLERTLPLRPYGTTGRIVFEVRDEMCPWNEGRWALEAGPEGSAVSRTKDTPQLSMHVSGLAQLLFGTVSPTQALRIGRAEAAPDAPLELWDAMWRTAYAPFCPDGF